MSTRRIYFQNTNPGHNKDYEIVVDYDTLIVTSAWGKIDGPKSQRRESAGSVYALDALVRAKMDKRESRGYDLVSDDSTTVTGMVSAPAAATAASGTITHARTTVRMADAWTLNRDIWEMERAERLAKKGPKLP